MPTDTLRYDFNGPIPGLISIYSPFLLNTTAIFYCSSSLPFFMSIFCSFSSDPFPFLSRFSIVLLFIKRCNFCFTNFYHFLLYSFLYFKLSTKVHDHQQPLLETYPCMHDEHVCIPAHSGLQCFLDLFGSLNGQAQQW